MNLEYLGVSYPEEPVLFFVTSISSYWPLAINVSRPYICSWNYRKGSMGNTRLVTQTLLKRRLVSISKCTKWDFFPGFRIARRLYYCILEHLLFGLAKPYALDDLRYGIGLAPFFDKFVLKTRARLSYT